MAGRVARSRLPLRLRRTTSIRRKFDGGKLMDEALGQVEKIDAVFAYDDAAAYAAYQAAKAAGREKGVLFVGVGGLPDRGRGLCVARHPRRHVPESDRRGRGRRRRREALARREGAEEIVPATRVITKDPACRAGTTVQPGSRTTGREAESTCPTDPEPTIPAGRLGRVDRRLSDPPAPGFRRPRRLRHPRRLRAGVLRDAGEEPDPHLVGCTREDCAGFAADAYARLNGIGAVCVTYCVGGLSLCNSIAGAYAEKSPVVVISGSPGMRERFNNPLLHHRVKDFHTQAEVFRRICCAEAELNDPHTALREIDRVLAAVVRHRRPGYIELPRDMVGVVPDGPHTPTRKDARQRSRGPGRGGRRGRAPHLGQPEAGDHRRRGGPSLRAARRAAEVCRRGGNPHHGHDARQERRQRAPSAVCGHLRRRAWAGKRSRSSSSRATA